MIRLSAVMEHGRIYVKDAEPAWDKPEWIVRYYPTRFGRQDLSSWSTDRPDDRVEDIRVEKRRYGYGYYLRFPGCGFDSEVELRGDSRAERVETEPYPCPKLRAGIETRYRDGRWQKLLKSGWKDV
jgi:hypothetical protein